MKKIELITQEPTCQIVTASKWLVDALLAMNSSNRRHKVSRSHQLATDILLGKFLLTASGIGVDRNGVLSDGQHRLHAIKHAGYGGSSAALESFKAAASWAGARWKWKIDEDAA